jgi:hypothetical protein
MAEAHCLPRAGPVDQPVNGFGVDHAHRTVSHAGADAPDRLQGSRPSQTKARMSLCVPALSWMPCRKPETGTGASKSFNSLSSENAGIDRKTNKYIGVFTSTGSTRSFLEKQKIARKPRSRALAMRRGDAALVNQLESAEAGKRKS